MNVLLDRLGQVLYRSEVSAISIGPGSRNFKIKNKPIGAHLTPEETFFGLLSIQLDRAYQDVCTVKFSASQNKAFGRNLIYT